MEVVRHGGADTLDRQVSRVSEDDRHRDEADDEREGRGHGAPRCRDGLLLSFHQWNDITAAEQPGIVCYLRSLAPASQTGRQNFGGAAP